MLSSETAARALLCEGFQEPQVGRHRSSPSQARHRVKLKVPPRQEKHLLVTDYRAHCGMALTTSNGCWFRRPVRPYGRREGLFSHEQPGNLPGRDLNFSFHCRTI